MTHSSSAVAQLLPTARWYVLSLVFLSLVFAGLQLGLVPLAALSISQDLLGAGYDKVQGGTWFAWHTASLMLGAAIGGILLGALGDRLGRARALAVSVLIYSLGGGAGAWVNNEQQLLVLRFVTGLGVGGTWPNGVALAAECWSKGSRTLVAGVAGTGINIGILLVSQIGRWREIDEHSWRWLMLVGGSPVVLGGLMLFAMPESPAWLAGRSSNSSARKSGSGGELFRSPLATRTLIGMVLGAIPLVGAWAAAKWIIPWADEVGGVSEPAYKATTQGFWACGAILGSFFGSYLANLLGRRVTYFLISLGATLVTCGIFLFSAPLRVEFLPLVFCQAAVSTLFFGWLPLYLPELFPMHVRAAGIGIAYNSGRFASAAGVLGSGLLLSWSDGNYVTVGVTSGLVYALGMVVILWAPDTTATNFDA